jgi:hypothetical protein
MDDSGGSGGGGQPPVPGVSLSGGGVMSDGNGNYYGVIGGQVTITVSTPIDENIQSVTYTVSGAVQGQSWTLSAGSSTRLPGSVTHPDQPGQQLGTGDSLSFDWDETTGNHSVSVQVNYPEGAANPVNISVSVEKPDADMNMVSNPMQFGTFNIGNSQVIGFYQTAPGVYFTASVTTHRFGGDFALLQQISIDLVQNYAATPQITETSPTVLDWNGQNQNDPLAIMLGDMSYTMNPGETQNIPFSRPPFQPPPVSQINDTRTSRSLGTAIL